MAFRIVVLKCWLTAKNKNGEEINIPVSSHMEPMKLKFLFERMGFPADAVYRKRKNNTPSNFPLSDKDVEILRLYEGIRLGEFTIEPILFFRRLTQKEWMGH